MSRYTLTVISSDSRFDPDAAVGHDPPLRTLFLQAFPDESGDDLALWLGTSDREYETLDALHAAALAKGSTSCRCLTTSRPARKRSGAGIRPAHDGPLAALLRHLQSE